MTSVWDKLKPKESGFSDSDVIKLADKGGPKYGTISIETEPEPVPDPEKTAQIEMDEMDIALKACGFGRFQILLLTASALGLCAEVIVTASTAYVLTAAECDLDMSLVQKGFLSAATYSGMLLSTVPAGFLTDTFGRRVFLMIGFGGIFIFQVLGGLSQTFEVLIFAKVCSGVLFAISFNPLVAMTAEYCYNDIRDRLLMLQSSFVPVSQIFTALLAWGVLMNEWEYSLFGGYIQLHAWNFYLLICSLFSLLAWILYSFIPESPKFLISINKYDEARNVLVKIYTENTGMAPESYPYYNIWRDKSKLQRKVAKSSWWEQIVTGYNNTKPIFKKPLGPVLILICVMQFVCMMTHNVIRFWYPQLATIIEHYSGVEADDGSKDLCIMLDTYTSELSSKITNVTEFGVSGVCVPTKAGTETYVNTIILGFVCFIPYLVSGILIQKIAKKYLICVGGLMVFACTLALRWTSSKPVLVSLFSTDVAVSQLLTSLFHNVIVEYYPAVVRSFAMAVVVTLGRLGSLLGNVFFPILLNIGCVVPFFTLAGLMLGFTLLSAFLPNI